MGDGKHLTQGYPLACTHLFSYINGDEVYLITLSTLRHAITKFTKIPTNFQRLHDCNDD